MTSGFLILRYYISCPFVTDSVNTVYEKFYPREQTAKNRYRDDPRNRIIPAKEARCLIEKYRMVKVWETTDGTVWRVDRSNSLLSPGDKAEWNCV